MNEKLNDNKQDAAAQKQSRHPSECVCVKLYEDKSIAVNDNLQDIFLRCWCDSTRTTNNIVHVGGFFRYKIV